MEITQKEHLEIATSAMENMSLQITCLYRELRNVLQEKKKTKFRMIVEYYFMQNSQNIVKKTCKKSQQCTI